MSTQNINTIGDTIRKFTKGPDQSMYMHACTQILVIVLYNIICDAYHNYSGKLSKRKTFVNISWRKLSRNAEPFVHMGTTCPKFQGEKFRGWLSIASSLPQSFPLYGDQI